MIGYRLRHRVDFEEKIIDRDSNGHVIETWVIAKVAGKKMTGVPAEVLTGAGREFMQSDAKQVQIASRINLRWFPGLSESWRVKWDGRIYDITSAETDRTGRQEWRLKCVGGVGNGG